MRSAFAFQKELMEKSAFATNQHDSAGHDRQQDRAWFRDTGNTEPCEAILICWCGAATGRGEQGAGVIVKAAAEGATANPARCVRDYGIVPFADVASLVEGAVRAGIIDVGTDLGHLFDGPAIIGIGGGDAAFTVCIGRIARTVEICCFVPLVLAGNVNGCAHIFADDAGIAAKRVGSGLRVSGSLSVVHPVGEACRVVPAYEVHRPVGHVSEVGADGVLCANAGTAVESNAAVVTASHVGIVDAIWVISRRVHRVEESGVLGVGHLVLADLIFVANRAVASGICRISGIADRDVINGDDRRGTGE